MCDIHVRMCDHRLDLMCRCLDWAHLAPTAPDTLSTYPFPDRDPFILGSTPHVLFAGNQPGFATRTVTGGFGWPLYLLLGLGAAILYSVVCLSAPSCEHHVRVGPCMGASQSHVHKIDYSPAHEHEHVITGFFHVTLWLRIFFLAFFPAGPAGQEVRVVALPAFSSSSTLVLLNLRTLACHPISFGAGAEAGTQQ